MAGRRQQLSYTFNAETGQYVREVGKARKSTDGLRSSYAKAALQAAAAAVSFRALQKVVVDSLKAQSEQVDAINKLNIALANQGLYSETASHNLQAYASALQDSSTFGDEAILKAQALAASFGMNEEQIKRTTQVALDFAAATGRDLTQAMNLLGKAFVGETGEMSRYGIILDKNIPKSEKFNAVIDQMTQRFGGQAFAATKTFSGGLQQLENAVGDVQESMGKFFGFMLSSGGKPFDTAIQAAKNMQLFYGVTLPLALSSFVAKMLDALALLTQAQIKILEFGESIPGIGKLLPDAALKNMKEVLYNLQGAAEKVAKDGVKAAYSVGELMDVANNPSAAQAMENLADETEDAGKKADEAKVKVWALGDAVMTLPPAVNLTAEAFSEAQLEAAKFGNMQLVKLPAAVDHTKSVFGDLGTKIKDTKNETVNWTQALQDAANQMTALGGAGKVIGEISAGIAGIGASVGTLKSGFKQFDSGGGFLNQLGGIGGMISGGLGIASSVIGIGSAIIGLFKSDPVEDAQKKAGQQLGMNISKEMAEQFLKQAEQTGQSVQQVAQQWFEDMKKALRDEGMTQAMGGLQMQVAALEGAPQYAEVAARNFNVIFWETVKDKGLPAALEAFEGIFSQLRAAFGDQLPPGFERLETLFGLMNDPAVKAQLQFAQGQAQFVGGATKAGFYDSSMTKDSVNIAQDTLQNLRQQGVDDKSAYQMIGGLLQAELNAAMASGQKIDAGLQQLLNEAQANGVQILPGIAEQQLDVLKKIYQNLSGQTYTPPGAGGGGGGGESPNIPGGSGGPNPQPPPRPSGYPPGKPWPPSGFPMAEGGIVTGPTQALIGERGTEVVMPLGQLSQIGPELAALRHDLPRAIARAVRDGMAQSRGG